MGNDLSEHFYPKGIVKAKKPSDIKLQSGGKPKGLPMCPGCGHLMQRVLSIDSNTIREVLGIETDDIDLVFCWRCPASVHFAFTGNLKNGFEFYSCWWNKEAGFPDEAEPFHKHPRMRRISFQQEDEIRHGLHLRMVGETSYEDVLAEWERAGLDYYADEPAYQIGGVPFLWQGLFDTNCQRCKAPLKFLATVANQNGTKVGWCGCDSVVMVFMRCEECGLIHASQQVD